MASVPSGPRSDVNDMVRSQHHFFVVFHDDNRVAQIAEVFQRFDQLYIIACMESDARFIQNIEYAHELSTNLCSQPDALGLSSAQGPQRPVEMEIIQSNVQQKAHAFADFF